ncbi:hypothetical protein V1506DRAFT_535742 [Lipomyces tetrasporus]
MMGQIDRLFVLLGRCCRCMDMVLFHRLTEFSSFFFFFLSWILLFTRHITWILLVIVRWELIHAIFCVVCELFMESFFFGTIRRVFYDRP